MTLTVARVKGSVVRMTPPSLEDAREILSNAATTARASGDPFAEIGASAIDVVLAELGRRGRWESLESPAMEPQRAASSGVSAAAFSGTTHGTSVPPDALVSDMLPCPFCGRADVLHVEAFPGGDWPTVRCRSCLCIGPTPPREGRDQRGAIAIWNRRRPAVGDAYWTCHEEASCTGCGKTAILYRQEGGHPPWLCGDCERKREREQAEPAVPLQPTRKVEVRTREQAIALFGRGSALASMPLPFVMVDGTAIAEPAPGAPSVLCGNLVNRGGAGGGSCCLRYGHDEECKVVSGPPIDCPARITRPCAADRVRATLACWSDEEREAARKILAPAAGTVQMFCANPGPPIGDKRLPLIDKHGRPVGIATAHGDLLKIELIDQDMAKRLGVLGASVSVGYTVAGEPCEVKEVEDGS